MPYNPHSFQINEWKALAFAFKWNERTGALFSIIDRYENTSAAFQGGNDGPINREKTESTVELKLVFPRYQSRAKIVVDEGGSIVELTIYGLDNEDILDVSYLPMNLRVLSLIDGFLAGINLSALPQRLEILDLRNNQIFKMIVASTPPSLKVLRLEDNPLEKEGVTLQLPLPQGLRLTVKAIASVNLHGGEKTKLDDGKLSWIDFWRDGTRIEVREVEGSW